MTLTLALLAYCCLLLLPASTALFSSNTKWTPSTFPNPTQDVQRCNRGVPSWICDADSLLSRKSSNVMEGVIKLIEAGESPYIKRKCGGAGEQGYEVAVAIMKEMDTGGKDADVAAKEFAEQLHALWGVGRAECQNGVLIFVAVQNRQIYISTGKGTMKYLTDRVLDQIIGQSKPFFQKEQYDQALEHAVVNTGLALAGKALPSPMEDAPSPWLFVFLIVFGAVGFVSYRSNQKSKQRYAACSSMLERIKRDQAALQAGSYAVTSCPICLEDFPAPLAPEPPGTPQQEAPSVLADSLSAEVGADEGAAAQEPLIDRSRSAASARVLGARSSSSSRAFNGASSSSGDDIAAVGQAQAGTQGDTEGGGSGNLRVPLALPCGHLFCEPCLTRWLEQRKTSCPICRADMGGPDDTPSQPPPPPPRCQPNAQAQWEDDFPEPAFFYGPQANMRPRHQRNHWRSHYPFIRPYWSYNRPLDVQTQQRELYRQDLMFRLQALRMRYPEYITPHMARTWGNDVASGRALSASVLRDFQLRDPAVRAQLESHGSSGMTSGFGGGGGGGGSSGGGRGGSW